MEKVIASWRTLYLCDMYRKKMKFLLEKLNSMIGCIFDAIDWNERIWTEIGLQSKQFFQFLSVIRTKYQPMARNQRQYRLFNVAFDYYNHRASNLRSTMQARNLNLSAPVHVSLLGWAVWNFDFHSCGITVQLAEKNYIHFLCSERKTKLHSVCPNAIRSFVGETKLHLQNLMQLGTVCRKDEIAFRET